jgi:hypothetical protein
VRFHKSSHAWIRVFDDAEVVFLLHVLDPLPGLALRVDHQRPASGVGDDHPVVDGKLKEKKITKWRPESNPVL